MVPRRRHAPGKRRNNFHHKQRTQNKQPTAHALPNSRGARGGGRGGVALKSERVKHNTRWTWLPPPSGTSLRGDRKESTAPALVVSSANQPNSEVPRAKLKRNKHVAAKTKTSTLRHLTAPLVSPAPAPASAAGAIPDVDVADDDDDLVDLGVGASGLAGSGAKRRFCGLMSQWTIPLEWR